MAILINGRTVVHKNSKGTLTTIDPCYTGPQRQVLNYQNVAKSSDATNTAKTVFINGVPVCHKNSYFEKSYGSEAGDGGGVKSGTNCGKAEFVTASSNVFIEGIPAVRQGDKMVSNNRNTEPAPLMQPGVPFKGDQEKINQFPKMPFPQLEFNLSELPLIQIETISPTTARHIKISLFGSITLQKDGSTNPLTFDMDGYKMNARQTLSNFFSYMTIISITNSKAGIGSTITGEYWTSNVTFEPPNRWIFGANPKPIEKIFQDWKIQGEIGYKTTIENNRAVPIFVESEVLGECLAELASKFLLKLIVATWVLG